MGFAGALADEDFGENETLNSSCCRFEFNRQSPLSPKFLSVLAFSVPKKREKEFDFAFYLRLLNAIAIAAMTMMITAAAIAT
jgi:hypothetical protein